MPIIDSNKCNDCGICKKVCPGYQIDVRTIQNKTITEESVYSKYIGYYIDCYTGYSLNNDIRYNSASGGLITSLLLYALENKIIDGCLVTRMNANNPLEPNIIIAKTLNEIIIASRSKYCPVPANTTLKKINDLEGKYAVVGLPCHLHGIRKLEDLLTNIKEKIILHFGLFCSHVPNFWATTTYLKRIKIDIKEIQELNYRGQGWPGYMQIKLKDNKEISIPLEYWNFIGSDFFIPTRCLICPDQAAELADVSFGDAWLNNMKDDIGTSIIISRTEYGEKFLKESVRNKIIELRPISAKNVIYAQKSAIFFKKRIVVANMKILRKKLYNETLIANLSFKEYLISFLCIISHYLSQNMITRFLISILPNKIFNIYQSYLHLLYKKNIAAWYKIH